MCVWMCVWVDYTERKCLSGLQKMSLLLQQFHAARHTRTRLWWWPTQAKPHPTPAVCMRNTQALTHMTQRIRSVGARSIRQTRPAAGRACMTSRA